MKCVKLVTAQKLPRMGAKDGRMNEMGEMSAPLIFLLPTIPYTSSLVTRLSLTFCALFWVKNKAPEEEAGPELSILNSLKHFCFNVLN